MRRFIGKFFAWIGGLVVVGGLLSIGLLIYLAQSKPKIPTKVILELDLESGLVENLPEDPISKMMNAEKADLRTLLTTLQIAENDPRVVGLIAKVGSGPLGMAHIQELRDAIIHFRSKNKFAVAFAETFGEFGPGTGGYYLATAFDTIWLQPSGDVGFSGIMLSSPFIRGTLDKLGVFPQMDHRKEYKNAMNIFTEKKFTAPHKESLTSIATSWLTQVTHGIADGRGLPLTQVHALVHEGPFSSKEALDFKLVDHLGYRDDCYSSVKQRAGGQAEFLYSWAYAQRLPEPSKKKNTKTLALIYGLGQVGRGKSQTSPFSGSSKMGSDTIAAAFRAAVRDPNVKAIVFRVDSPGGSYSASDTIWKEVLLAKKAGKPVIVSMGNVAASGGYFVAMAADKIVAEPGTLTGSIGVVGGKMIPTKLLNDLGITFDEVHIGRNAKMWSPLDRYNETEWKKFQAWLDRAYEDFTSKVAEGRKLPKEKALELAKGRVWTGEEAKEKGLIDEVGGLTTAINLAKNLTGMKDEELAVEVFPRPKGPLETFAEKLSGQEPQNSDRDPAQAAIIQAIKSLQPVIRTAEKTGIFHQEILEAEGIPEGI